MKRQGRTLAAILLGVISLSVAATAPGRQTRCSLCEFIGYYQSLSESERPVGFWERVTVSLALASAHK